MRYVTALKRICKFCQLVRRDRDLYVVCKDNARHKQKQIHYSKKPQGGKPSSLLM